MFLQAKRRSILNDLLTNLVVYNVNKTIIKLVGVSIIFVNFTESTHHAEQFLLLSIILIKFTTKNARLWMIIFLRG